VTLYKGEGYCIPNYFVTNIKLHYLLHIVLWEFYSMMYIFLVLCRIIPGSFLRFCVVLETIIFGKVCQVTCGRLVLLPHNNVFSTNRTDHDYFSNTPHGGQIWFVLLL
jgi:hypothetical protein